MTDTLLQRAAAARAAGQVRAADRPRERRSAHEAGAAVSLPIRSASVQRAAGADDASTIGGYASVTESPYEMYDFFGPYTEVVSRGAFAATLATSPLVEFTVNHGAGGALPMAHTRNGTLLLTEDDTGLAYSASVDPARSDVQNLLLALSRGDMAEASFKFRITSGMWSPDYTEYRIDATDLEHGDVSTVNFGANPAASSELRGLAAVVEQVRALDPPDVNMMTQVLGWLSAIDMIVDEAQETLAAYLEVPNPDADDMAENADTAPSLSRLTAFLSVAS